MDDQDVQLYSASNWPPIDEREPEDLDDQECPERRYEAFQAIRDEEILEQQIASRQ